MKPTFIAVSLPNASLQHGVPNRIEKGRRRGSGPFTCANTQAERPFAQEECSMAEIHARLAHMGIYVHDRENMQRFYREVLGLIVTDEGTGRAGMHLTFMSGNPQNHHQLVLVTGRPDTSGFNPIQQMSFMVDSLADLREVHRRALALGATEMRPVSHGNAWSIYFKDPEGNTVEAYLDTPFHVPQPHGKPLDLSKSDEQILRETEEQCRHDPGFMPIEQFKQKMAARLGASA
jgi:catechol 2,3-dioxygenase